MTTIRQCLDDRAKLDAAQANGEFNFKHHLQRRNLLPGVMTFVKLRGHFFESMHVHLLKNLYNDDVRNS